MKLLKTLCSIHAPSGNEGAMTKFLLTYIKKQNNWLVKPKVFYGPDFQNCIVLVFGKPRTAVFAHMDSIGFTVRYKHQLVKIGGPELEEGTELVGSDVDGPVSCTLKIDKEKGLCYESKRKIATGTDLTFKPNFRETKNSVQCCYMDNRLGVWNALKLAETLTDGAIVFSCWEEHGGGSVGYLSKFLYEKYGIQQALISDITWVTEGVLAGKGVAISMRDSGIPRREYLNKIIKIARQSEIDFQLEVESSGGSDGNELQRTPFPWDWCFVGAPEKNVHSANEKVHKNDIASMLDLYRVLMEKL
jgi:putative aminopeptidase FrvX